MKKSSIMIAGAAFALAALCAVPADAKDYFHHTEIQMHMDFARHKGFYDANGSKIEEDILTATFLHASEWKYGDNFMFLELMPKITLKIIICYVIQLMANILFIILRPSKILKIIKMKQIVIMAMMEEFTI